MKPDTFLNMSYPCGPGLPSVLSQNLKYNFFYFLIYFWLRRVLAAARGIFVEAVKIFFVVHGLLSSCGVRVFSSLVVAHRLQDAWAL